MRRQLTSRERALWDRVAETVVPLMPAPLRQASPKEELPDRPAPQARPAVRLPAASAPATKASAKPPRPLPQQTLDATWDRKLARGAASPDFTLDLHGCTLDAAHARLDHGLSLALSQGARVVLLITGRPRPHEDHASRGERRGAIRAKFVDWLAHGSHASKIAAIRPAHPRHGGAGAVYIILRRQN